MGDRLTVAEKAAKAGTVRISGKRGKGKKNRPAMGTARTAATAGKKGKGGAKGKAKAAPKKTLPKYARVSRK